MSHTLNNFDWEIYLMNYPDLIDLQTEQDASLHYIHIGHLENRTDQIPEIFDVEKYFNTYPHLRFQTARDAYLHFMKLGILYNQQVPCTPFQLLTTNQYNKIIKYNRSLLRKPPAHVKPFVPPPRPKVPVSSGPRIPKAPNAFNPPKEPLKKSRPTQSIFNQIQPKIVATNPSIKQQIQTTASSIIKPKPPQKSTIEPNPQTTLSEIRESVKPNVLKRQPQAPIAIHLPKELFKKPKPTQAIFDQVLPKVDIATPVIKQRMHTTATSMMNPKEYFSRKVKSQPPPPLAQPFPIIRETIPKRPSIAIVPSKQLTTNQRPIQAIFEQLQPKVVHSTPVLKQKIQTTTSLTNHKPSHF